MHEQQGRGTIAFYSGANGKSDQNLVPVVPSHVLFIPS
jgi:hypothetical protein